MLLLMLLLHIFNSKNETCFFIICSRFIQISTQICVLVRVSLFAKYGLGRVLLNGIGFSSHRFSLERQYNTLTPPYVHHLFVSLVSVRILTILYSELFFPFFQYFSRPFFFKESMNTQSKIFWRFKILTLMGEQRNTEHNSVVKFCE